MTTRHHMEFQAGRMAEPVRTADYEEFVERYQEGEEVPTLEQWQEHMISLYNPQAIATGRIRVWLVTREELEVVTDSEVSEKVG